ncbi:MAG: hypothetical protein GSR81_01985 [Desulfurococcales archaeon]|nr:hypothetical protein [Desulfurococcales archaeon]
MDINDDINHRQICIKGREIIRAVLRDYFNGEAVLDMDSFYIRWVLRIMQPIRKLYGAIVFSRNVDTKINEFGKKLHNELKLPYYEFKLNYKDKISLFIKYIRDKHSLGYTDLINIYLDKIIKKFLEINNLDYSKDTLKLLIIVSYREDVKFRMGKTIIDIDTEPYLRILEQIKNNAPEKNLLASLYNVFNSDIVKKRPPRFI